MNRRVTGNDDPGCTVPLVGVAAKPVLPVPVEAVSEVNVSAALPPLAMVKVRVAFSPMFTLPKARSPETEMIRVDVAGGADDGELGDFPPPHDAAANARNKTIIRLTVVSLRFHRACHQPVFR